MKRFWKAENAGKTLYLHIGLQKTGTTTIQDFFTLNRLLLASEGFDYPDPCNTRIGMDGHNHGHLSMCLTGYWRETAYHLSREDAWGELRSLYFDSAGHLVVSHEGLSTPQMIQYLGFIKTMLKGIQVKAIIYLRRQDIFVQSVYKERLKSGESRDFQQAYAGGDYPRLLDFHAILQHWQKCVGKGNVIVRLFEKGQLVEGDALDDFLQVIGADGIKGLIRPARHSNPTMSRSLLEISRALNAMELKSAKIAAFKWWLNDVLSEHGGAAMDEHKLIKPAECIDILNKFAIGNEKIAREYLGRSNGRLFYDALPDPDEDWQRYAGIPPEDVARMLAAMFDKYSILDN